MINDYLYLSVEEVRTFENICLEHQGYDGKGKATVPNDLVFAKTIHLRNMAIRVTGMKDLVTFQFTDDITKTLTDSYFCGVVTIGSLAGSIHTMEDSKGLFVQILGVDGQMVSQETIEAGINSGAFDELHGAMMAALAAWYGIQIALLNPYVKDVFRTETIRKTAFNPNGKKRKSVVKYIRHHYLNPGALSPKTEAGQLLRKTMAWYVVGHWRHYQDGKTIFIQPYWKGPLRETKVCEPRERKVV